MANPFDALTEAMNNINERLSGAFNVKAPRSSIVSKIKDKVYTFMRMLANGLHDIVFIIVMLAMLCVLIDLVWVFVKSGLVLNYDELLHVFCSAMVGALLSIIYKFL